MRALLALSLAAVVVLVALCAGAPSGGESYPQGPCDPGSETTYQCNTCKCTPDGTGYACTRQLCPPRERRQARCVPGRTYPAPDGCNTCTCSSTGHMACTLRLCLDLPGGRPTLRV